MSTIDGRRRVAARRMLLATGLVDELPEIPGLAERWGKDVLHCPFCHGWEVRGRALGVLSTGPMAAYQTLLFRALSEDVVLFTHTGPPPTEEESEKYAALGVRVVDGEVARVETVDDALSGVTMVDGRVIAREAIVVTSGPRGREDLPPGPAGRRHRHGGHRSSRRTATQRRAATGHRHGRVRQEGAAVSSSNLPDAGASSTMGEERDVVPDPRRWLALAVFAAAILLVVLDTSIVNLALPRAQHDLGISDANRQWAVTSYTIAFGGLLPAARRARAPPLQRRVRGHRLLRPQVHRPARATGVVCCRRCWS